MIQFILQVKCEDGEDGTQNYLVLQPLYRYFKSVIGIGSVDYIYFWKSNESSDEKVTDPTTSDCSLNLQLSCFGTKARVEFRESCLNQDKITYTHRKLLHFSWDK